MKETKENNLLAHTWLLIHLQNGYNEHRKLPGYLYLITESQYFDSSSAWQDRPLHVSKCVSDGSAGRVRLGMNSLVRNAPCPEGFEAKDSLSVARISDSMEFIS